MKRITTFLLPLLLFLTACGTIPGTETGTPEITQDVTATATTEVTLSPSSTATLSPTATDTPDPTPTREVDYRPRNRISYNVNGEAVQDWVVLTEHLVRLQPSALLIMNNIGAACNLQTMLPDTVIIHRDYSHYEGEEWYHKPNPDQWLPLWQAQGCKEILRYATNEPGTWDIGALLLQETRLMREAKAQGFRLSVGNFGVGTIPEWPIEAGLFDDWLIEISRGDHVIGAHEYTTAILPIGIGLYSREQMLSTSAMQPSNWAVDVNFSYWGISAQNYTSEGLPAGIEAQIYEASIQPDVSEFTAQSASCLPDGHTYPPFWHIFRTYWLILRAECIGINDIEIYSTEGLWDNLNDLDAVEPRVRTIWREQYGIGEYMNDMRGIPTYNRLWADYFRQWSPDVAAICQMVWWDYLAPDNYKSSMLFTWSTDQTWAAFRVDDRPGIQTLLERWNDGEDMTNICGDYTWAS